ncbi:heme A synthase [Ramlibacter sp. G-1-2-2]|uniref:Heme A synthase n=1 Tax=Ramlibacter agri TaxID=2728837 RepID=A0A848H619_9BURK|nr:COX15/CtaA family protein [Ramlibacter agri]NML43148.1 heme A synthase [Ramlibacter agri]
MTDASLYDLTPAISLLLVGLAVASGPLTWVWLRHRQAGRGQWVVALTVLTLFLSFDLVLFGAFTRLTDSGLGCPDWPGCYGNTSPTGASAQIRAEEVRLPEGPVTHSKAWIEMVHRYLAGGIGILALTLAAATWWRRRDLAVSPWWPTATVLWICVQAAFGALTVTMKLFPAIVTLHLLGGMVLLALLTVQEVAYRQAQRGSGPLALAAPLRGWLIAAYALLWLQVALGGWVSTNYAVLACSSFPTCQGSWWPPMNFAQGFELWRHLGMTGAGEPITFYALTAIHYTHRLAAYAVFLVLGVLAWQLRRGPLHRFAKWLGVLLGWQFLSGLSNVVLGWPMVAALAHTGGAAGLVVALTWAIRESRAEDTVARSAHAREVRA